MNNDYIENKKLFNDILKRNYFEKFKNKSNHLEIFIKGSCNNQCDYCYLGKYHKELYPQEIENNNNIINNINLLIQWYIENKFTCEIDLFSGEWVTSDLCFPILDLFYNNFKSIPLAYRPYKIVIPDSMNFLYNENLTNKIQEYIDKFKYELHIPFYFSASIDGKYCDSFPKSDKFYSDCSQFCQKNNFGFHPMVSSNNISNWIKNYEWFKTIIPQKYLYKQMFLLEVRDETWDYNDIQKLLEFLNYYIDNTFINIFNSNKKEFLKYILKIDDYRYWQSQLIQIKDNGVFVNEDRIPCSIQQTLCVRAGDLSIGLCHRLFYDELILGNFIVEDNKIIDIDVNNVSLQIMKDHIKRSCMPICEKCSLVNLCPGPCLGNAYENFKNPLVPPEEVCNMFKAKYGFLIDKYNQMGLFDLIKSTNILRNNKSFEQYLFDLKDNIV